MNYGGAIQAGTSGLADILEQKQAEADAAKAKRDAEKQSKADLAAAQSQARTAAQLAAQKPSAAAAHKLEVAQAKLANVQKRAAQFAVTQPAPEVKKAAFNWKPWAIGAGVLGAGYFGYRWFKR